MWKPRGAATGVPAPRRARCPCGCRRFLVTGTQTAERAHATLREFCLVEAWDIGGNAVTSCGLVRPSSESLTHAALYDASPAIRVVLHAHAPQIWRQARALGLPVPHAS